MTFNTDRTWLLNDLTLATLDSDWAKYISPGELFSWGYNYRGGLGLGDVNSRSSPTQVGSLDTWSKVSASSLPGEAGSAIKTDGTLWTWGGNYHGQLGLNDIIDRSSPVQVGSDTNWNFTSGDFRIKIDGTLWAVGYNYVGRLGLGDTNDRSSPTQVGALTDWSKVFSGRTHTLAIKVNGTLWSWGSNFHGQLGLGDILPRSSPTQVGILTTWMHASTGYDGCSLAIKTDGTLWSWGLNSSGQLGLNDIIDRSSPVQIGVLTTWSSASAGGYFTLAIKTDGTLWSWGQNTDGQLGIGNVILKSSPTQVGILTNWATLGELSGGTTFSCAITSDRVLWAWGSGNVGGLGLGDVNSRSSPTQVGTTSWNIISAGAGFTLGITG